MTAVVVDRSLGEVPQPAKRRIPVTPTWLPLLAWAALGLMITFIALEYWRTPPYSPDSWSYYELSRHLGTDFLRIDTYRSYQSTAPYSSSFGPLWPIAIRIVGTVTGTTARGGFIAAFACVAATAVALEAFGRRAAGLRGFGPLVTLGLLAFPPYVDEVVTARSIPLALFLVALLLWVLSRPPDGAMWHSAVAGGIGALLVLTRTDTLLALALLYGVLLVSRRMPWRQAAVAGAAFVTVMLPWMVYSLIHFQTLLAGDNKLIASAVQPHYVTHVLDPNRVPTVSDDPWGWLQRVLGNVRPTVDEWWAALPPSVIGTALAGVAWLLLFPEGRGQSWLRLPFLALLCFTVQTATAQFTTGYRDQRYISGMVLLLLVLAVGQIMSGEVPDTLGGRWAGVVAGLVLVLVPVYYAHYGTRFVGHSAPDALTGGVVERELRRCHDPNTTLVVTGVTAYRHGALTGRMTTDFPGNLADLPIADRRAWIEAYNVGQYYEPPGVASVESFASMRATLAAAATLTRDPCATIGQLYRVSAPRGP
jgi:hypothetical protein